MSQILILLRKSLLNYSRARAAIAITFIVPIVLIFIVGLVFGVNRTDSGPSGIEIAVVNLSHDPAATDLINALKAEKTFSVVTATKQADGTLRPLTEADVRVALHDNDYHYALLLPEDMVSESRFGVRLQFLSNPRNDIEAQMVNGILQKTVFSHVPQLLGQSLQRNAKRYLGGERYTKFNQGIAATVASAFGGDPAEVQHQLEAGQMFGGLTAVDDATKPAAAGAAKSASTNDAFSRMIKIDTEQVVGKDVQNPMAARIVGGYAIMFLLFAVSGSATAMFEEKSTGVFARLLSSPVTPGHIVWARFAFGMILGVVQICALFLAGRLFFGLDIFSHAGGLLAVAVAAAAACSAFGILIAAIAPSADAARGLSTFIVISMSAIGGAWFPVSFMPGYIQAISKLTIVYWSVEGMTDVLWAGHSLVAVLPKIGVLAAIAAAVMLVSVWLFNRNRFFEN